MKSPVIAANGAIVREKNENKVIYENPIDTKDCIKLIEMLYKMKMFFHFYTLDGIYCSDNLTKIATKLYMAKQIGYEHLKINYFVINNLKKWEEVFEKTHGQITKCIAFTLDPKKSKELKEKLDKFSNLVYYGSGSRSVEINNKGVSKGNAVKALADYYGFKRDEIVCIGDNENDISMIEYAGVGVAMGNAIEPLKKLADYTTDTNKNNGVAKAIKKLFKI